MRFFSTPPLRRVLSWSAFILSTACFAQGSIATSTLPDEPAVQANSTAQQSDPPTKSPEDKKKELEDAAQKELKAEEQQHLLGVVPTYNAVFTGRALPLNAKQKFDLAITSAVTPYQFVMTGIVAGIGQAQNSFPEYGQGMEGYAKRYGASYADYFNGQMLGNAVLPVLLHQDPRYFRKGTGSFSSRLLWSVASTVRCKGDNGNWQPNISNIAGNIMAGGISNLYYPASDRGVGLTFERGMVVTAEGVFGAVLLEFTPDIQRYMFHKRHRPQPQSLPQQP